MIPAEAQRLQGALNTLETRSVDGAPAGYREYAAYPVDFQAAAFPYCADGNLLVANNHAFFFVGAVRDENKKIVDLQLNTAALERLFRAIAARSDKLHERPWVHLRVDADLFENPARFVEKYQGLRAEPTRAEREHWLAKEGELIRAFVNDGGFQALATEILKPRKTPFFKDRRVDYFFEHHFRFEGVRINERLGYATWELLLPDGHSLVARQAYEAGTHMTERKWQLGLTKHMVSMAGEGHIGARQVLQTVEYNYNLPRIDLTRGLTPAPT